MNPLLLVDSYKIHHNRMYPDGMTKLYSNLTPRKSRIQGVDKVVVFGIQHFVLEYLIKKFNNDFFKISKEDVISEYKRHCQVDTKHIEDLWDLGYLPIEIKSLKEGSLCPIGVPLLTITNTHPKFAWLVNYLETLISCSLWQPITSATIANEYKKILNRYAIETTGNTDGVQWQGHDFSMRGMSSSESAILSGMGHLLSFTGSDTIPAIYQLEKSYKASGLIGASVPASEHSVLCMGTKENQLDTLLRHIKIYPDGILSEVMDTWDLTQVVKPSNDGLLFQAKDAIMSRNGKVVIRPDSCPKGRTPADIICGHDDKLTDREMEAYYPEFYNKGLIQCLWEIFGGTVNNKGYKVLDCHIGGLYGDSITLQEAEQIMIRLKEKGFATTIENIVLGIGSMTYTGGETTKDKQYWVTRDLLGFAIKSTYGEITHEDGTLECREIFKDPITDDGMKKSKTGLLRVNGDSLNVTGCDDKRSWKEEQQGLLQTVFKDGKLFNETTLEEIRERLQATL